MNADYSITNFSSGTVSYLPEYPEYWIVLGGHGTVQTDGELLELGPREVLGLKTGAEITCRSADNALIGKFIIRDIPDPIPHIRRIPADHARLIHQIFLFALEIQGTPVPYYDGLMSSLSSLMFSALISADLRSSNMNETVFLIIEDINSNFLDPDYDVHAVIERTGYTINHFRKLFKSVTGLPPVAFLNRRRLDYARDLIIRSPEELPLAEIASRCGYHDPYYFAKLFKKREGMTPKEYAQRQQSSP